MNGKSRLVAAGALGGVGLAAAALVVPGQAAAVASVVAASEGESMASVQGYGTSIRTDAAASGGKMLRINSAVTARAQVNLPSAASSFEVTMRTDDASGGGASARVRIDGVLVTTQAVASTKWTAYSFSRPVSSGTHELRVEFLNPQKRNLFVDVTRFSAEGATPTPTPSTTNTVTPTPTATATPTPTTTTATPSPSGSVGEVRAQAYVTGYSYWDNTPAGSVDISDPVLHQKAGGSGTYVDPITVAVGHSIIGGKDILDFPAGTRFYVPNLRRYFIVEDTCGDGNTPQNGPCHTGFPTGAEYWLDVWVGGGSVSKTQSDTCMNALTDVHTVIRNPAANYAVVAGEITANCAQYGETPTTA